MENKPKRCEILRSLRAGKSCREVAHDLGISESTLVKYERGERNPSDNMKRKIAKYYKKSVAFIFYS